MEELRIDDDDESMMMRVWYLIYKFRIGCNFKNNNMTNSQLLMVGNTFRLLMNYV